MKSAYRVLYLIGHLALFDPREKPDKIDVEYPIVSRLLSLSYLDIFGSIQIFVIHLYFIRT